MLPLPWQPATRHSRRVLRRSIIAQLKWCHSAARSMRKDATKRADITSGAESTRCWMIIHFSIDSGWLIKLQCDINACDTWMCGVRNVEHSCNKPVGNWISAPSPNVVDPQTDWLSDPQMKILGSTFWALWGLNQKSKRFCSFYQRVSIASYASAGIARGEMSACLSVCRSVCHTPVLYQNEEI